MPRVAAVARPPYAAGGGRIVVAPQMHTGVTIIASQPVVRITISTKLLKSDSHPGECLYLPLLFKESATAAPREQREGL